MSLKIQKSTNEALENPTCPPKYYQSDFVIFPAGVPRGQNGDRVNTENYTNTCRIQSGIRGDLDPTQFSE